MKENTEIEREIEREINTNCIFNKTKLIISLLRKKKYNVVEYYISKYNYNLFINKNKLLYLIINDKIQNSLDFLIEKYEYEFKFSKDNIDLWTFITETKGLRLNLKNKYESKTNEDYNLIENIFNDCIINNNELYLLSDCAILNFGKKFLNKAIDNNAFNVVENILYVYKCEHIIDEINLISLLKRCLNVDKCDTTKIIIRYLEE